MRFLLRVSFVLVLSATHVFTSGWLSKAGYKRWHDTELGRWLSDHEIPFSTPANRKELEATVEENWDQKVLAPVSHSTEVLLDYTANAKNWLFNTWNESQLRAFLRKYQVPFSEKDKHLGLLDRARNNYETVAKLIGETVSYPGNWLYETWSDSELKEYLDKHGYEIPHLINREELIASVRRNSFLRSMETKKEPAEAARAAAATKENLAEMLFQGWSESDFRNFFKNHGVRLPQGVSKDDLVALARKNKHLLSEKPTSTPKNAFSATTSNLGKKYTHAKDKAQTEKDRLFGLAVQKWSDARLKGFLDIREVPVPSSSSRDKLLSQVQLYRQKAAKGCSVWTFDTWSIDNLKNYLALQHKKATKAFGDNRSELLKRAKSSYEQASKTGETEYAVASSYLSSIANSAKEGVSDSWPKSDLENYLESYGIDWRNIPSIEDMRKEAERQTHYFYYGTARPETSQSSLMAGLARIWEKAKIGALSGRNEGNRETNAVRDRGAEALSRVAAEL